MMDSGRFVQAAPQFVLSVGSIAGTAGRALSFIVNVGGLANCLASMTSRF